MKVLSNVPPHANSKELWNHFSKTYMSLRAGLCLLAFTLPLLLYFYGKLRYDLDLQPSMSAYFWAANHDQCATFPMRTIFVGYLFAIGVGLFAYKGLTNRENTLLNLAAICAFVVALYPERLTVAEAAREPRVAQLFLNCPAVESWAMVESYPIHYIAAVLLFVLIGFVAWSCAEISLKYLPSDYSQKKFRIIYRVIAVAMILVPFVGVTFAYLSGLLSDYVFFIEATGVVTFGFYWLVKTVELKLSSLENDPEEAIKYAVIREGSDMGKGSGGVTSGNSRAQANL